VFVGCPFSSGDKVAYVDTDNVGGGREAASVLVERGCRRFGTVAETTDPPLTTIRNPIGLMAERATRMLIEQLDGTSDGTPVRMVFPPALVRRASA
jgi:DNA-binding LacI/PurR family transcriptional regulator